VGDVRFAHVGGVGVWSYVARGARYRGAPYAVGAAAVGGAALGAVAAGAAYPYGATCDYYPYPPCYQAIMS
jgi:hypothetical protein